MHETRAKRTKAKETSGEMTCRGPDLPFPPALSCSLPTWAPSVDGYRSAPELTRLVMGCNRGPCGVAVGDLPGRPGPVPPSGPGERPGREGPVSGPGE